MDEWERRKLHHRDKCRKCRHMIEVFVEHEVHLTRCHECTRDAFADPVLEGE